LKIFGGSNKDVEGSGKGWTSLCVLSIFGNISSFGAVFGMSITLFSFAILLFETF
jgi:hypothetical protein